MDRRHAAVASIVTAALLASRCLASPDSTATACPPPPPAHVTPFPAVIDFESYRDTTALANDWIAFGRGSGYQASTRLVARGETGQALALDFTLGGSGGGQSGVSYAAPWSAGLPNAWDLSARPGLSLSARAIGGPVVVTFVCFCLDARSPSGETPFFTRFEVAETSQTCYVSFAQLGRGTLQTPGSLTPDLTRVVDIQFLPDAVPSGPETLLIDNIRPSELPDDFPTLTPPRAAGDAQLVVLAFDDCGDFDGLAWIHDELEALDLEGKATLFLTTVYGDPACPQGFDWQRIRNEWRRFANERCELGNHSHSHNQDTQTGEPIDGTRMSVDAWTKELEVAERQIVSWTGVTPRVARAPRLETSRAYFDALAGLGYASDSSLQLGGSKFHSRSWPHRLRYGLAPDEWARMLPLPPFARVGNDWVPASGPQYMQHQETIGRHEVLSLGISEWDRASSEIPVASFVENLAFTSYTPDAPRDWQTAARIIEDDFDRHYNGNRSPFHVGAHAQTLVYNPSTAALGETIDWQGRRLVLDAVLRYMRSKHDVKFVRASELLELQKSPEHSRDDHETDRHSDHRE